jgi:hypothetical protein
MPPAEFETKISAGERPHNYALDRAATGTGKPELLPHYKEALFPLERADSLCQTEKQWELRSSEILHSVNLLVTDT